MRNAKTGLGIIQGRGLRTTRMEGHWRAGYSETDKPGSVRGGGRRSRKVTSPAAYSTATSMYIRRRRASG